MPQPKNSTSFDLSNFFIQAAGLAYHWRTKCGVYHQPLWGCISSRFSEHLTCGLMIYNTSCWWYTRLTPWWYTRLRRDVAQEFESLLKIAQNIFFVAFIQTKEHCSRSALLFGNEAHLRCMKNEAGLRPMKRGFATRRGYCALRFMRAKIAKQFASAS